MSTSFYDFNRRRAGEELQARICNELYLCGELSLRKLADRVGVAKSPSFRRTISEMIGMGTLRHRWVAYKSTGMVLVDLSPDVFGNFHQHIPSMAGTEK